MIPESNFVPKGKLLMQVHVGSRLFDSRRAHNMVLRSGADLIAKLFAGTANTQPINTVRVGFARETGTTDLTALTPPDLPVAKEALQSKVGPNDFIIASDQPGTIRVSVNALFKPTVELKDVSEAGLLAGEVLYNQVVFEPVTLRPGQDVTFFWEINFPFGH